MLTERHYCLQLQSHAFQEIVVQQYRCILCLNQECMLRECKYTEAGVLCRMRTYPADTCHDPSSSIVVETHSGLREGSGSNSGRQQQL